MPRARPPGPLFALPKGLVFNDPLLRRWNLYLLPVVKVTQLAQLVWSGRAGWAAGLGREKRLVIGDDKAGEACSQRACKCHSCGVAFVSVERCARECQAL